MTLVAHLPNETTTDLFGFDAPGAVKLNGTVYIGTSGYSFPDWKDVFYPSGLPRGKWLEYYAQHFPVVEINATYYRIPTAQAFETMAQAVPSDFGFWVKVPGGVTHRNLEIPGQMYILHTALEPLTTHGKLRGLLAQFPNSFKNTADSWERLKTLAGCLNGAPLAVEFRRAEWQTSETAAGLEELDLIPVSVDLPRMKGLPVLEASGGSRCAYLRLHGRNLRAWYDRSQGDRYNYEYSQSEINEIADVARRMDEHAESTYIFFNNCHAGQAVRNARMLKQILENSLPFAADA